MPLVGTNFYGTQVQRTPYDDAEAQRAQGLDAWNMAQHQNDWQNQRHGQSRSDARAMNRDNHGPAGCVGRSPAPDARSHLEPGHDAVR